MPACCACFQAYFAFAYTKVRSRTAIFHSRMLRAVVKGARSESKVGIHRHGAPVHAM